MSFKGLVTIIVVILLGSCGKNSKNTQASQLKEVPEKKIALDTSGDKNAEKTQVSDGSVDTLPKVFKSFILPNSSILNISTGAANLDSI